VELRLAIGRDGLGLELGRPVALGPLLVTELAVRLPNVRFPLDVSGGVSRFRHRRGDLSRVAVELRAADLARWAAPRWRGILGAGPVEVWLGVGRGTATVALIDGARVLAFDVVAEAADDELRLAVTEARGSELPAPATALAAAAMDAAIGAIARREGSLFIVSGSLARLARAILPDAGARTPSTAGVHWTGIAGADDAWLLYAAEGGIRAEPTPRAAATREACLIARAADDVRFARAFDAARALDVASLERAPRHPEICRRIAEIDAHAGGRAEAALATLAEAERPPRVAILRGELLAESGDKDGAIAAFLAAGDEEVVPALSARAYERAAAIASGPDEAIVALDRAVARAPSIARIRWARVASRLALGRIEDARADIEHLEAQARGSKARFDVWWRAGAAWRAAGLVVDAAPLFERALRFVPDDPDALRGLGSALVEEGRRERGVLLLARAVELAERRGLDVHAHVVELARALAERIADRPAAIARLRAIPADAREAADARALEGRWRAELGDLAGASLAFARLRERAETFADKAVDDATRRALVGYLAEAARFERDVQRDRLAAQRHLAAALRLSPRDVAIGDAYRAVGAEIAQAARDEAAPPAPSATMAAPPSAAPAPSWERGPGAAAAAHGLGLAEREARVDELTRRMQLDPTDDAVADELTAHLLDLGRSHELLALLSAQIEDAPAERRAALVPKRVAVLERLEADARARGDAAEADLFAALRDALPPD